MKESKASAKLLKNFQDRYKIDFLAKINCCFSIGNQRVSKNTSSVWLIIHISQIVRDRLLTNSKNISRYPVCHTTEYYSYSYGIDLLNLQSNSVPHF